MSSEKGKDVPVHTMKTYRGSKCIVPLILNHSSRWRSVVIFMPQLLEPWGKELEYKAGWVPEPVWMFWRGDTFLAPAKN